MSARLYDGMTADELLDQTLTQALRKARAEIIDEWKALNGYHDLLNAFSAAGEEIVALRKLSEQRRVRIVEMERKYFDTMGEEFSNVVFERDRLREAWNFVKAWCESEIATPVTNSWESGHQEAARSILCDARFLGAALAAPEPAGK